MHFALLEDSRRGITTQTIIAMKNLIKLIILVLVFLPVIQSCEETSNNPEPTPLQLTPKSKMLIEADNAFGLELFREVVSSEDETKNIMVSPLSVSLALAMTYNGADSTTKEAMEEVLHLSGLTVEEINNSYKNLINAMISLDPKVTLDIANSIWYRDDFFVEPDFLDVNKTYYNAEVTPLDFTDPASLGIINNWVAENTNDKIKKIISEIDPLDVMFLINAIYFKGIWTYQFDPEMTSDLPFYMASGISEEVPFMIMEADMMYFMNDFFEAIELPYGKGDYSMIVMVPLGDKTTGDVIDQMTAENLDSWFSSFYLREGLEIHLPTFRFEYEKSLNEILSTLGMAIAFLGGEADFSKINPYFELFISEVKHKTFVEVNEEGTEAAAVTSVTITLTSIEPSNRFEANKPFLFMIKENTSNALIFMGKVALPVLED